jgi:hypothetical protein
VCNFAFSEAVKAYHGLAPCSGREFADALAAEIGQPTNISQRLKALPTHEEKIALLGWPSLPTIKVSERPRRWQNPSFLVG